MTRTWSYNWRQSPAHVWFLTTFVKPRRPDDHFQDISWESALGEPPAQALERFLVQGVVRRAPLPVALEVQFTRDELRELLRERNLPTGGTKAEMVERLVAARAIIATDVYQCTDGGYKLAVAYLENPAQLVRPDDAPPPTDEAAPRPLPERDVRRVLR